MRSIYVAHTVDAGTNYANGDAVGTVGSINPAVRYPGGSAMLHSLTVFDAEAQNKDITLLFFSRDPSSSSGGSATVTDNLAFAWGSSKPYFLGRYEVEDTDYLTITDASATGRSIGLILENEDTTNKIYFVVIANEAINFGATTDLSFRFGLLQAE